MLLSSTLYSKKLKEGNYRGVLFLNEEAGIELPFNFTVIYKNKKPIIEIRNADERITIDEITIIGDSVNFKMPIFDTEFKTVLAGRDLEGVWINNYKTQKNKIKFKATFGETKRFLFTPEEPNPLFEGKWEVTFSPNEKESSKAIGIFKHLEQTDYITGTFLTETGDYRYLEGIKNGNQLFLSAFDGSHAFLFTAEYSNETLSGTFYSGSSWQESWIGKRNPTFKLRDAEEISFAKNKDEKLNFSFPNLEGKQISLSDKRYENKPVVVQIMGSWCPNCMDESAYFSTIYKLYKDQGLEIIALAFEKTTDFEKAKKQVARLKTRLNIDYEILITQQTGKDKASETLTALNKITAFPTTLFLNKEHKVVKVHTGFNGPATGNEYVIFKQRTENLIKNLLKK
ncbi:TlpA disulfide reductase family protein [Aurantibacillus circumpalustris]|uniref:TlpA disulfide reductase family protein n=1 Tax=Aurantibacillus circumpalustris TaxID=3036359 RepID=UPI00295A9781|nr:TlpA disulfide reductase family protein [Aurantibacillus circumpalustris]